LPRQPKLEQSVGTVGDSLPRILAAAELGERALRPWRGDARRLDL